MLLSLALLFPCLDSGTYHYSVVFICTVISNEHDFGQIIIIMVSFTLLIRVNKTEKLAVHHPGLWLSS